MMRRRVGTFLIMLGALLLLGAVGLLAYNQWDDWRAGTMVAEIQDALENAEDTRSQDKLDPLKVAAAAEEVIDEEMATIEVDGYEYIGTLSISRYGLELPIMAEWSYAGLKIAPGRYTGSAWTDNLIICGHNYERHFGNLKNLEAGDAITFTDVDGNEFYYEVTEVLILQPTAISEMLDQETIEWDLTLFTCTVGGQTRVTVRCSRVEE
ncbi:MAG: sortase [Lachnospiraceae bacterium]|nr:sortase [Lachnospiraceae bacterium]